ncbi:MAG: septum site-determining protein MinD [Eubacteriales bacterium]|nr:septum site-determining protein MinD [Eubacteriales bacterium]
MSQSWLVASGKGGVGKSMVTAALGMALAKRKMQCCCVDADLGLRDLDMVLNMHNKVVYDMLDVARKECKLKYALINHPQYGNLSLLPASQNGSSKSLDGAEYSRIIEKLKKRFAYVITDAPAGLERGLRNLIPASDHCLLVVTPDDVAIRDAERVLALMDEEQKPRPLLVVNRVVEDMVVKDEMYSPQTVANALDVPLLGYVPEDRAVLSAMKRHECFMEVDCPAAQAMDRICQRFLGEFVPMPVIRKKRSFFGWVQA